MINWNIVTLPKSLEGSGLCRSQPMNHAYIMKFGWFLMVGESETKI